MVGDWQDSVVVVTPVSRPLSNRDFFLIAAGKAIGAFVLFVSEAEVQWLAMSLLGGAIGLTAVATWNVIRNERSRVEPPLSATSPEETRAPEAPT